MYVTRDGEEWNLNIRSADGTGDVETVYTHEGFVSAVSWSPEHNAVFLLVGDGEKDVFVLSLDDRAAPVARPIASQGGEVWGHSFSPDGRWVAYSSSRDGPFEIFVSPYPELTPQRKVSVGGGTEPLWSTDGSELFYHTGNQWMAIPMSTGIDFRADSPVELFQTPFVDSLAVSWDLSSDGRFLVVRPALEAPDPTELRLVQNWFTELTRLVPVP